VRALSVICMKMKHKDCGNHHITSCQAGFAGFRHKLLCLWRQLKLCCRKMTHSPLLEHNPMATSAKSARKPNAAFMKPLTPSPTLAAIIGAEPLPRTEVTKKIWEYIKKHD